MMPKLNSIQKIKVLGILAGILYSSWPLGYILNPKVEKRSLASGLEALHQPYNWLFIATDIVSSVLIITMCILLWQRYRNNLAPYHHIILLSITLFAIGTIVDASLPEHCVPNLMQCASFTQDHYLLFHGIFSILASVFLFIALFLSWMRKPKNLLLSSLLIAYILFGLISLIQALTPGKDGNWSQDYYITLCSLWIACFPYVFNKITSLRDYLQGK